MSQDIWTLCAMKINGTILDGIEEQSIPTGIREIIKAADGQVDPTYAAIMEQDPKMTFRTCHIASFLGLCGIGGLAISSTVILYFQKTDPSGTRVSGSNHRTATIAAGMVIPRNISAAQGQDAKLTFDVIAISSDGLTAPITFATGVALPTLSGVTELFTLGPLQINGGTTEEGIQSFDFDFGIKEKLMRHGGLVYPVRVHIESREPMAKWKHSDASKLATLGLSGTAQGASASIAWLRKMAREATRVANVTAQHISFTFYDGIFKVTNVGGSHPSEQSVDIELKPISDGSNPIVAISAAAAIT